MDLFLIDFFGIFLLIILIMLVLIVILLNTSFWKSNLIIEKEKILDLEKNRLKIVNRKYMQNKIKKEVFESLKEDIEEKLILTEMDIFRLRKAHLLEIENKLNEIYKKITRQTKHRKVQLTRLVTNAELVRKEMGYLEHKLLKREISENLFKKLIKNKEHELISIEIDIINLIKKANEE